MLALIFPLIGILFILISYVYIKNDSKKKKKAIDDVEKKDLEHDEKKLSELEQFIGIEDIKDNTIILSENRTRVILSISSSDFELLTPEEQFNMENALIQFGLALSHDVVFFTTPTRIEVSEPSKAIKEFLDSKDTSISEELRMFAQETLINLKELENKKGTYVRKSFCVVGINNTGNRAKDLNELQYRINSVASKLSRARMRVNILSSEQILQLLTDIFQKGSSVLIKQLLSDGVLELYSEGSGRIIYDEVIQEEEKTS